MEALRRQVFGACTREPILVAPQKSKNLIADEGRRYAKNTQMLRSGSKRRDCQNFCVRGVDGFVRTGFTTVSCSGLRVQGCFPFCRCSLVRSRHLFLRPDLHFPGQSGASPVKFAASSAAGPEPRAAPLGASMARTHNLTGLSTTPCFGKAGAAWFRLPGEQSVRHLA